MWFDAYGWVYLVDVAAFQSDSAWVYNRQPGLRTCSGPAWSALETLERWRWPRRLERRRGATRIPSPA